jgi:transcription initiation factor TFIIH subunit 1
MTTCQTAANEFLRQFWSSIYPPPTDLPTLSVATPAQKATKAAKMIGYLSKTREKVDALLRAARLEAVDPTSVQTVSTFDITSALIARSIKIDLQAMGPVMNAVDFALDFYRTRHAPRT